MGRYCHAMYKLLYRSIRARTAPPVSVRVRVRVSVNFSMRILFCMCPADLAIAALCDSGPESGLLRNIGLYGSLLLLAYYP